MDSRSTLAFSSRAMIVLATRETATARFILLARQRKQKEIRIVIFRL